jgi:hypothetical protein
MLARPIRARRSAPPPSLRCVLDVAWLVLVALVVPAGAGAGTAEIRGSKEGSEGTARLYYRAGPGERNSLHVFLDWSEEADSLRTGPPDPARPPTAYVVDDRGLEDPGDGCERMPPAHQDLIRCPIPDGARALGPKIWLGDRGDFACVAVGLPDGSVVAGRGDDDIRALGSLRGGPGDDSLVAPTSDDNETYRECRPPGARAPKGLPVFASGGRGDDYIEASGRVFGGSGRDVIDLLGPAVAVPGPGLDEVFGSHGDQLIRAQDSMADIIYCSGRRYRETVLADGLDVPSTYEGRCEDWRRRGAARAAPIALEGDLDYDGTLDSPLSLEVVCPPDGPPVCVGAAALRVPGGRMLAPVSFRVPRDSSRYLSMPVPRAVRSRYTYGPRPDAVSGHDVRVSAWSRDSDGVVRTVRTVLNLFLNGPPGTE